jgi:hypothetical protein
MGFPERLLQLFDPFFQRSFSGSISLEAVLHILLLPVVQKPGGNTVPPAELGRSADPGICSRFVAF